MRVKLNHFKLFNLPHTRAARRRLSPSRTTKPSVSNCSRAALIRAGFSPTPGGQFLKRQGLASRPQKGLQNQAAHLPVRAAKGALPGIVGAAPVGVGAGSLHGRAVSP